MSKVITDAELVNQFAQKASEEPAQVIETKAPSESEVQLPGGFIEPTGEVLKTAEVQELTGADEEAIARAGTTAKAFTILLERGLVKLGSRELRKDDLDQLLSGDRDAILIGIRTVTFGNELPLSVVCNSCNSNQEAIVDLSTDVPVRTLDDPIGSRTWEVKTKIGPVQVTLPTGTTQKKLIDNADKTVAEINTLLLSSCIMSVNGLPSAGASTALALGMADRTSIIDEIITRNPGPRLGEVKKACKACGEDMLLPLSLLDLFRV